MTTAPGSQPVSEGPDDAGCLHEAREALGRQLAAFRQAKGLSQRKLAPLTGFPAATVAKAEQGRPSAGSGFRWKADDALGCPHCGQPFALQVARGVQAPP
jgi:transcriptional regulator with XRE-family HTH domain